jgi:hypothetical protein
MQANLERGKAAFRTRSVGLSVAILAGAPLIAALALFAPDRALAACGGASHPAGVHAAGSGGGSVHAATGIAAPSGGGGGGGSLGCANGSSASALHGLPVAASGRVVEPGVHAAHGTTHERTAATRTAATSTATTRTATTRTANTSAHLGGVKPRRP